MNEERRCRSSDQQQLHEGWSRHLNGTCIAGGRKPGVWVPAVPHKLCDLRNAPSLSIPRFVYLWSRSLCLLSSQTVVLNGKGWYTQSTAIVSASAKARSRLDWPVPVARIRQTLQQTWWFSAKVIMSNLSGQRLLKQIRLSQNVFRGPPATNRTRRAS